jgi:hypothetical protein
MPIRPGVDENSELLFEALDHVLSVAERLPVDPPGNDVRRSVCEMIEASSADERRARIGCLLDIIECVQRKQGGTDSVAINALRDAVRQLSPAPE